MYNLSARMISGIIAFVMGALPFAQGGANTDTLGTDKGGVKTVYVSVDAKDGGNGTEKKPFSSIEEARDALRSVDKSAYKEIDVIVGAGQYEVRETVTFTAEDSGSEKCHVRYIGEDGAVLSGGVTFTSDDFTAASGDTVKYFPEDAKDKLVMIDLKQFGFTPDDVVEMTEIKYGNKNSFLFADGNKMTVARYPNDGFATVGAGSRINSEGGCATAIDLVDTTTIYFGAEHMAHVSTWHDPEHTFTIARYNNLWCPDNTNILSIDEDNNSMEVIFAGGYDPKEGMPFYWYNVPEELDTPGEYYIDENCVLYLYPTENHAETVYSMPVLNDNIVTLDGAEYISFEGIKFTSSRGDGISGKGDHITVDGCDISYIGVSGVYIDGVCNTVQNSTASAIGQTAIRLDGGDQEKLIRSNNLIYNNYVTNWSIGMGLMAFAYSVRGCGATVSHNECENSVDMGIEYNGPYHTVEYNYCGDTCRFFGDGGVIGSGDIFAYGTVVRYNYVKNAGFTRDLSIDIVGVQGITVDCGQSGLTAYGNVIENVTGSGFGLSGGRDLEIYGNLMISCRWGMFYDGRFLISGLDAWNARGENTTIDDGANRVRRGQWQVNNENWLKAFPVLATYTYYEEGMDYGEDCLGKTTFVSAPVSKIYDNVYYLDKATHDKTGITVVKPFSLDWVVKEYSGESVEVPSADDGTLYTFSSKRTSYNIEDCIAENQNNLAITVEQFNEIGRVK